jgi:predicted amidophosphoribosyltransferase
MVRNVCINCGAPSRLDYCPECIREMGKENGIKVSELKDKPEEGVYRDLQ